MAYDPVTNTWAYSGFRSQSTVAARLAMARLHAEEISNLIAGRSQGGGESFDPTPLLALLKTVEDQIARYEREDDAGSGVGLPRLVSTVTRDLLRRR